MVSAPSNALETSGLGFPYLAFWGLRSWRLGPRVFVALGQGSFCFRVRTFPGWDLPTHALHCEIKCKQSQSAYSLCRERGCWSLISHFACTPCVW
eukprot:1887037-Rhodomonas_salina.1